VKNSNINISEKQILVVNKKWKYKFILYYL
jgi:hypothetical protein